MGQRGLEPPNILKQRVIPLGILKELHSFLKEKFLREMLADHSSSNLYFGCSSSSPPYFKYLPTALYPLFKRNETAAKTEALLAQKRRNLK